MTTQMPGLEGPATIQDVAARAGVSRAAVSKVIRNAYGVSPAMKARVGLAIEELGYRPSVAARAMRGSSFTIGIELPGLGNPFFTQIVAGATQALDGSPYQLIIAPATNDREEGMRAIDSLADRQVDGLIAVSPLVSDAWLERVAGRIPVVMLGRHVVTDAYDSVTGDDVEGTRVVMEHLFSLGHRDIAHLTVREEVTTRAPASPHSIRVVEYERLMREAGLGEYVRVQRTGLQEDDDIYPPSLELLSSSRRPTAVFAGNDSLALPLMRARDDLGLTAADVSIVGYDDIEIGSLPAIGLTSVDQFGRRMGERMIALLLERIGGRTEAVHEMLQPELRVRTSSTTVPRAAATPPA